MTISLAPMEGITTYVYRNAIYRHFGCIDCFYTPFLTASHIKGREKRDVDPKNNQVPRLVPQVLVNDPELFVTISEQLEALGYDEVNLNLGCPSGTVTSKGRGAGFLDRLTELDRFLEKIFTACPIDISIKTRIGYEFTSEWEDLARIYEKYPVKEMIIHPRTGRELYNGHAHADIYNEMVSYLSPKMSGTVFTYNGDITDETSLSGIMQNITIKPDNIMIGRGLIADPSLAYKLGNGHTINDLKKRFMDFHEELLENYKEEMNHEDQVVKKMKELWVYLSKGFNIPQKEMKLLMKANTITSYKNQFQVITSYIDQRKD